MVVRGDGEACLVNVLFIEFQGGAARGVGKLQAYETKLKPSRGYVWDFFLIDCHQWHFNDERHLVDKNRKGRALTG